MTSPAITSVFNDAYIAEVYESYRRDPGSVDESWRHYFRTAEALAGLIGAQPASAPPGTPEEKRALLVRLTEVDGLERYLGFRYQGKKRFSIEGTDALVPMLDAAIAETAADGARAVVIGMAHRGRLNVLTHVMGKPYEVLFGEFEGRHPNADSDSETGDVKYHMGYRGRRAVAGAEVEVELVPNPSH